MKDLYYRYPLLDLSYGQRFLRKVSRNTLGIILLASAFVMFFSDVATLSFLGAVILAFLGYGFAVRFVKARPKPKFKGGNLANFITPRTRKVILLAYDRSSFLGGSFLLHLARELADDSMVMRVLRGLDIGREEFVSKLEAYMAQEKGVKETNIWKQAKAEEAVVAALVEQGSEKRPIEPFHLFVGLPRTDSERVGRLFALFGLDAERLEKAARYHAIIR